MDPAIVGRSYREGVEAVADLLDLNPILFPRSLLAEFLRVGPDQFLKIDEVGQMAAWDIGLTGYRRPTAITEKQMEHVCSNQRMRSDPQIYSVISSFEPEPEPASDPIPLSEKMVVRSEQTVEGVAGCTVRARLYGDVLFLLADTTSSEAGEAPAQNDGEGDIFTLNSLADDISPVDPDSYTPAYFLFEPSTKVRTLKGGPVAATQTTASPEATPGAAVPQATLWNHNGSTMRLEASAGTLSMILTKFPGRACYRSVCAKGKICSPAAETGASFPALRASSIRVAASMISRPWAPCPTMKRTSGFAETPLALTASATRAAYGRKTGRSLTCRPPNRGLPRSGRRGWALGN